VATGACVAAGGATGAVALPAQAAKIGAAANVVNVRKRRRESFCIPIITLLSNV
jgi:hypothetical protein